MSGAKQYSFVFVCQQGDMELQALLLAASLRRHLSDDHEIVAAIPSPFDIWGTVSPITIQILEELNVRQVTITNKISGHYGVGNKLSCLTVATSGCQKILLDSDILCLRNFIHNEAFAGHISAKPADVDTLGRTTISWAPLYRHFGLELPKDKVTTTVSKQAVLPYFNAGVVAVSADNEFGKVWIDTCIQLRQLDKKMQDLFWLDQIALPIAARRLGLTIESLDEHYNYPLHFKPISQDDLPLFVHYHNPHTIGKSGIVCELVQSLARRHQGVYELARAHPNWMALLTTGDQIDVQLEDENISVLVRLYRRFVYNHALPLRWRVKIDQFAAKLIKAMAIIKETSARWPKTR